MLPFSDIAGNCRYIEDHFSAINFSGAVPRTYMDGLDSKFIITLIDYRDVITGLDNELVKSIWTEEGQGIFLENLPDVIQICDKHLKHATPDQYGSASMAATKEVEVLLRKSIDQKLKPQSPAQGSSHENKNANRSWAAFFKNPFRPKQTKSPAPGTMREQQENPAPTPTSGGDTSSSSSEAASRTRRG